LEKQLPFQKRLNDFKDLLSQHRSEQKSKLILLVVANTHDPEIAKGCAIDVRSIREVFQHLCQHTHYELCEMVVSGTDYSRTNILAAIDAVEPSGEDVTVFYYSGHGFSYKDDPSKIFPQIDLRQHDDNTRIGFINSHTENLSVVLDLLRLRGGRINIVIGDCCNSGLQFKRMFESKREIEIAEDILPPVSKAMSRKLFSESAVSILAAAANRGEYAISDSKTGSLFTHSFTRALGKLLANEPVSDSYLPWHHLLEESKNKALKLSEAYDIGGGKPGHQEAIFQIMLEKE
jgi:hypothetical protein